MKVMRETAMEYRKRVCLAMNHISGNLDRELPLEEIAGKASFSIFHLHRIFKAVVGETVRGFTRRLRLETAAHRLLANRRETVTRIALDCGFSSSQNFAKAFRQYFGVSPSLYRKSKKGNMIGNGENVLSLRVYYTETMELSHRNIPSWRKEMKTEIREMPDYTVAYVRKIGAYGKETCAEAFDEMMRWAGPNGYLGKGPVFGMYWDNPAVTPPDRCRTDACVAVPPGTATNGQVGLQVITGGSYAVCGFELGPDEFPQAWDEAFAWLVSSGYQCDDRPCFEMYHNNTEEHPEGKWIVDICIPLKKMC
ncbi:MAG: AraC family transcriptional regulator [Chlorobiaceae bacterium]|nr:AraC family transcriptional regulator [Chlorobiaceae bacterium]